MAEQTARRAALSDLEPIFAARGWLSENAFEFRALMLGEAVSIDMRPGATVFRADDDSNGIYGVISGGVGVDGGHRRQTPLMGHVMRAGDWFGTKALLPGGPRDLTYVATEPTRLVFVSRAKLIPLMQRDPEIAVRVGQLAEIGIRLGTWVARDLMTPDAGRRLAAVLFRVLGCGEVAPHDPQGFWLTHQQLGVMANLSRRHVGRKLSRFEAAGWIACGYNRVRLLDPEALAAFAYGDDE